MSRHTPSAFIILFFFISTTCLSQLSSDLYFRNYTLEDGLSQGSAEEIVQDSLGFIWIATQDGLNRFDGYSFKVYRNNRKNQNSLAGNNIRTLLYSSDGKIWIGTKDHGLDVFDPRTDIFIHYTNDPANSRSLPDDDVTSLFQDNAGNVWVGTAKGLARFEAGHFIFLKNKTGGSNETVRRITQDKNGRILAGMTSGLVTIDVKSNTYEQTTFGADRRNVTLPVFDILSDSKGRLWVGTFGHGVLRIDNDNQWTHFKSVPNDNASLTHNDVREIHEDKAGRIWIGTADGLNLFNEHTQTVRRIKRVAGIRNSLSDNFLSSIFEDRNGGLWFGTYNSGISFLDPASLPFHQYKSNPLDPSALGNNVIHSFAEDNKKRIWIATEGGGLESFDKKSGRFTHLLHREENSRSLSSDFVWVVYKDHDGKLWLATNEGFDIFDPEKKIFENHKIPVGDPNANIVNCFYRDREGTMWIGTWAGLVRYDQRANRFDRFHHDPKDPSSLSYNSVIAILEDSHSNLWVGTNGGGLNKFDRKIEKFVAYQYDPKAPHSISDNVIDCLHEDRKGRLWVGTYGGLNLFDYTTASFRAWFDSDGLSNNAVTGITEDTHGNLWIGTSDGLSRFDPDAQSFTIFDSGDGLARDELYVGAYFTDSEGYHYFGSADGFNVFHPDSLQQNRTAPAVALTGLLLLNKSLNGADTTHLSRPVTYATEINVTPQDQIFSLEFTALNFTQPEKSRYKYKLAGFDKSWITTTSEFRRATYTNVPPGTYTFTVGAANEDGVWNEDALRIKINVQPPWWQTWWARSLAAIAMVSVLLIVFRYRIAVIKRKSQTENQLQELEMKALKAQMNPHFVFNAMNSVQSLITNNNPDEALKYISKFSKLLRMVLENSERLFISVTDEIASLELYLQLESLRFNFSIDYKIEISESIDSDEERVPPFLLQPYVENSLWHGLSSKEGKKEIHIQIQADAGMLVCTVTDNGIGRDNAMKIRQQNGAAHPSRGLSITQRRLTLFNPGVQDPVSTEDLYEGGNPSGTKVTIRIPRHGK